MRISSWPLILFGLLSGCTVGPDYVEPDLSPPAGFIGSKHLQTNQAPQLERWWEGFADPKLNDIVTEALKSNLTLEAADARLAQARAVRRRSQLNLLPGFRVDAGYEKSEISKIRVPGVEDRSQTVYEGGFDALWELDFFGQVRRRVEANQALEDASYADVLAMQQSVVAEVVRTYLDLRGLQRRMAVAIDNAGKQREIADLTRKQFHAGAITELDVARASADTTSTLARVPPLRASVDAAMYRLAVLTGKQPEFYVANLSEPVAVPFYRNAIGLGDPEAMLQSRPDLRKVERELASAVANVGVAIGEYFPKIELTGSLTFEAENYSDLFDASTKVYNLGPRISWRAPQFLRIGREVDSAKALAREREAKYHEAVLKVLEEVEASLSRHGNERERYYLLQQAFRDTARAAELAHKQYEAGAIDLLAVLDADRQRLNVEEALTQSQVETVTSLVAVIKALGIPVQAKLS